MVDEHAALEVGLLLALNLDVDQEPGFFAAPQPDFDELINALDAEGGVADHLAQLVVQRLPTAMPIDVAVNVWKEEGDERLEPLGHHFLPGFVVDEHDDSSRSVSSQNTKSLRHQQGIPLLTPQADRVGIGDCYDDRLASTRHE